MPANIKSPEELIGSGPVSTVTTDKLTQNIELQTQVAEKPTIVPDEGEVTTVDDKPFDPDAFTAFKPQTPAKDATKSDKPVDKGLDPKDTKKEEAKETKLPEQKETVKEQPKEESHDIKPLKTVTQPKEVDITGFDETEQTYLKKMANDARQFVVSRLNEGKEAKAKVKELEGKLVEASKAPKIDNSRMYLLDQEFLGAAQAIENLTQEASIWAQALANIDGGEKWMRPVGYKPDGSIEYQEMEATKEARAFVTSKISQSQVLLEKNKTRANHIAQTYGERYQERLNAVKQYEDYIFPEMADPKVAEANPAIKSMKQFLDKSGFGDNILANAMAKMYAFSMGLVKENEELRKKAEIKETVKEVRQSTGPTNGEINTGRSGTDGKIDYKNPDAIPFDPEAFERRKG